MNGPHDRLPAPLMRRAPAAILVVLALAIIGTIATRSMGWRSSRDDAPPRGSAQPSLLSLRQLDASAFLTRHNLVEQGEPTVQHDTVTRIYALRNRLLHTRLRLILTVVADDRVIRAELGFAPFLLEGANGPATRALLSDLFSTFVPSTDAAGVADLRAQIELNSPLAIDSTVAHEQTDATHSAARPSEAYLALRYRRDSIMDRFSSSWLWIDNHYENWRRGIDSPNAWVDSATIVQIALPRDTMSRLLYTEWDQRPEALGGTLAVLRKCLGREEIDDKDAIRTGNTIRYAVWRNERKYDLLVQLDSTGAVQELTFQRLNRLNHTEGSALDLARPFLEIASRIVPDVDQGAVFALRYIRVGGGLRRSETQATRRIADALHGTRGSVVLNLNESSLRFDQLNGALPRMTLGVRGRFGAATDSAPE